GSRLLPVPAAQVGDARPRQRHSAEPDDIVALKAEREPASRPRELALEPLAMLRENPLDRGERGAPGQHDLDPSLRVDDDPNAPRARRAAHRDLDLPPADRDPRHEPSVRPAPATP